MNRKIGIFSICFYLILPLLVGLKKVEASAFELDVYDLGLSEFSRVNLIHAVIKDEKGLYWIGTETGLYRYDGRQVISVHSDKSMPLYNLPVSRLLLAGDKIWVGTLSGLYYISLDSYQISEVQALASLYVWNISVSGDDIVVLSNKQGAFRLTHKEGGFVLDEGLLQAQKSKGILFNKDAVITDDRKVWFSSKSGLYRYDPVSKLLSTPKDAAISYPGDLKVVAGQSVASVEKTANKFLLVSDRHYYAFDKNYKLLTKIELPCDVGERCSFLKLSGDRYGVVWGRLNLSSVAKVDDNLGRIQVASNTKSVYLSDLFLGQDGELLFYGLNTLKAARVGEGIYNTFNLSESNSALSDFVATSFYQDGLGNIWLSRDKLFIEFNPYNGELKQYFLHHSPYSFQVDEEKRIWLHDSESLNVIEFDSKNTQTRIISDVDVNSIVSSPIDGLWIIDTQYNIHRLDKKSNSLFSYPSSFCSNMIKRVYPRIVDNGLLAWSGEGFLCRYNRSLDSFEKINIENRGKADFPQKVFYSNGKYWVLSPAIEFYEFLPGANTLFANAIEDLDGVQLDQESQVLSDGYIWSLNQAKTRLYRINTNSHKVSFYNISEGVPRKHGSTLLGVIEGDQLVFSEPGKIVILDAAKLEQLQLDHSLKIHQLVVFAKDGGEKAILNVKDSIALLYTDDALEVSFGTTRPKANVSETIYYRLTGFNDNWIKTHRGFARFSDLSPGEYSFEIKDGFSSENRTSINITVEAPPWMRWWAYLIYTIVLGSILLSFIIQRLRYHRELKYLASVDSLTSLPNRHKIVEHMKSFARRKEAFSVLFIDLDRFKHVNDSLGHQVGDKLLILLATRLKATLNPESLISRLGGDEFLVVCKCSGDRLNAEKCAKKLIDTINEPLFLEKKLLHVSLSIGLAQYPSDADSIPLLMSRADAAMYEAKSHGGNAWCWHSKQMGQTSLNALILESKLHKAVQNKEFRPHYQAKYDMDSQRFVGYEALARWHCPADGIVSPSRFIDLAEKTGNIIDISWDILHQVCRQLEDLSISDQALPIAVNVSAKQLAIDNFSEKFRDLISRYNFEPSLLELEVTESMLLDNSRNAIKQLKLLKLQGHKIYIDDFGTGYSSLAYLKQLPVHSVKIDMVFVKDISVNESSRDIVSAIIYLAQKMKLEVIAEGVETLEVALILRDLGCDVVQGYYFSKPSSAIAIFDSGADIDDECILEPV
ncbi:EAL domain-containing protein [uncultured Pseudoteredinibacter sp.]|uniref:EAL domain-containing protein n=1 Tax=uncultured Pseudoteredinibacter sp. TaxID=1641701 RepID=UPI0026395E67|nr:EAL domain-containing protein [uncultured Pseudoteredinibacter sp.]